MSIPIKSSDVMDPRDRLGPASSSRFGDCGEHVQQAVGLAEEMLQQGVPIRRIVRLTKLNLTAIWAIAGRLTRNHLGLELTERCRELEITCRSLRQELEVSRGRIRDLERALQHAQTTGRTTA